MGRLVELIRRKGGRLTARDLSRGDRRYRNNVKLAETTLENLVQAGFGHWEDAPPGPKGGRPTRFFVLKDSYVDGAVDETAGSINEGSSSVDTHIPSGDETSDILILCGQLPDTIYTPGNTQEDDSLVELFLDDGNCIINTGDWIFYVVNSATTNGSAGLQTIMDISGVTMGSMDVDNMTVTADGQTFTPTLQDFQTDRAFVLTSLAGDWYTELALAQTDDGTKADPQGLELCLGFETRRGTDLSRDRREGPDKIPPNSLS